MEKTSKDRIKEMMDTLGISQKDIVSRTGLSKSRVSMYVSGKREPNQEGLAKISIAFGVSPAWLMGFDVPMYEQNNIIKYTETSIIDESGKISDVMERINNAIKTMDEHGLESLAQYAEFISRKDD